jgi:SAM-dependent methyltransferase
MNIAEKEAIEITFWETSQTENPESQSIDNILTKCAEARVFVEKMRGFESLFAGASRILELGAGQGWASCIVKRQYPNAHVVASDISAAAIASLPKWEHIYQVKLDNALACRSYSTPFPDGSFDLIFTYCAAHHFIKHRRTLREIKRLLRPQGTALYLYEPACQRYLYRLAHLRVNRKRPEVPEDVIRFRDLEALANDLGLTAKTHFAPTLTNRHPLETLYYLGLRSLPVLVQVLPCSADIVISTNPV